MVVRSVECSRSMETLNKDALFHICSFLDLASRLQLYQVNRALHTSMKTLVLDHYRVKDIIPVENGLQQMLSMVDEKDRDDLRAFFGQDAEPVSGIHILHHPWRMVHTAFSVADFPKYAPMMLDLGLPIASVTSRLSAELMEAMPYILVSITLQFSRLHRHILQACPAAVCLNNCDVSAIPLSYWKRMQRTCAFHWQNVCIGGETQVNCYLAYEHGQLTRAKRMEWNRETAIDFLFCGNVSHVCIANSKIPKVTMRCKTLTMRYCHIEDMLLPVTQHLHTDTCFWRSYHPDQTPHLETLHVFDPAVHKEITSRAFPCASEFFFNLYYGVSPSVTDL